MNNKIHVTPNELDIHLGKRLQLRRSMMGFSQKDLAETCGITSQQIQKYETAGNRISASRLFELSVALDTPVAFFYRGLPGFIEEDRRRPNGLRAYSPDENDPLGKNESLQLINLYWKLPNNAQRELIMKLMESIIKNE